MIEWAGGCATISHLGFSSSCLIGLPASALPCSPFLPNRHSFLKSKWIRFLLCPKLPMAPHFPQSESQGWKMVYSVLQAPTGPWPHTDQAPSHSTSGTAASLLFLKQVKETAASGPLLLLFPWTEALLTGFIYFPALSYPADQLKCSFCMFKTTLFLLCKPKRVWW